jgi:hypothetical protein
VPVYERYGMVLVGAWVTAMNNDSEAILIWAIPSWEQWAEFEKGQYGDEALAAWREVSVLKALNWNRFLLVDAPLSPMRTGRQPQESDRDSYQLPD